MSCCSRHNLANKHTGLSTVISPLASLRIDSGKIHQESCSGYTLAWETCIIIISIGHEKIDFCGFSFLLVVCFWIFLLSTLWKDCCKIYMSRKKGVKILWGMYVPDKWVNITFCSLGLGPNDLRKISPSTSQDGSSISWKVFKESVEWFWKTATSPLTLLPWRGRIDVLSPWCDCHCIKSPWKNSPRRSLPKMRVK